MQKTRLEKSIGWTDKTINPIKGMCKGGCWYCYAKPFYKRGRLTPEIRLDCSQFSRLPKTPKKVFLCSTHDLFGDWIPKNWRDIIFTNIEDNPQHTFQVLTKMPENIDRPMPDNVWLGVSIADGMDWWRWSYLIRAKAKIKFVSHEPILRETVYFPNDCDWFITGRLTGHGKKHDPKLGYLQELVGKSIVNKVPLFMKDNLKDIWGEDLIQEFPK